jgi:predicted outer membrane repeat protein
MAGKGGAIWEQSGGAVTASDCAFTSNSADLGGAIATVGNTGGLVATDCTFDGNRAGEGGGIYNELAAAVKGCTFSGNSAEAGGGFVNVPSTSGVLAIANLANCTFANNSASNGGGGIASAGTTTVTNCTVAGNSAVSGGGIFNGLNLTLNNTIVASSPSGGDVLNAGTVTGSHNLVDDGSDGLPDTVVASPLLGPLANNGGATQTVALLPGSPAIDAGSNALAVDAMRNPLTTDQRGVARIINGTVDIGAFESRGFTIAITSGNNQSTTVGTGFVNPLVATVTSPDGDPVQGGLVLFTAPTSGAGAILIGATGGVVTATIDPSGQAAVGLAANTVAGSYSVLARAIGTHFAAGFTLTNLPGAPADVEAFNPGQSTTVGYDFNTTLLAHVTDAYGNPVPGVSVFYFAPTSGASGSFKGGNVVATIAQTNTEGYAAPTFTANTVAGSYSVSAFANGVSKSIFFNLTNLPGAPARIATLTGTNQTAAVGSSFVIAPQAVVTDTYGNPVPGASVTFTAPTSGATGTFAGSTFTTVTTDALGHATAPTITSDTVAGSYLVTAYVSGVALPAVFSLTNLPGAPAAVARTGTTPSAAPLAVAVGSTLSPPIEVLVTDAYGNPVPGASVFFTAPNSGPTGSFVGGDLATTNAQGVASATLTADTKAGSYEIKVYAPGTNQVTFNLTNTPDVASRMLLSVPASAIRGTAFSFTVSALDQFGNFASGYLGTVAFSSSDRRASLPANYTFVAGDRGVHTFQATFNSTDSETLRVIDTVTPSLLSSAKVTVFPPGRTGTASSTASQLVSLVPPGAQIGALRAHARHRGARHVIANRHHDVKLHALGRAQGLSLKR